MKKMISEKKLRQLVREAIKKSKLVEALAPSVFESECILTAPLAQNITDVLTKMRAIESVTIVNIMPGGGKRVGSDIERLRLKIKFIKGGFSVKQRLAIIISKINRIEGVISFKIQSTRKLEQY